MNLLSTFRKIRKIYFIAEAIERSKIVLCGLMILCFSLFTNNAYSQLNQCVGDVFDTYKGLEDRGVVSLDPSSQTVTINIDADSGPFINRYQKEFIPEVGYVYDEIDVNGNIIAPGAQGERIPNINGGWINTGIKLEEYINPDGDGNDVTSLAIKAKGDISIEPWNHLKIELESEYLKSNQWLNITENMSVELPDMFRFYVLVNDNDAIFSDGYNQYVGGRNAFMYLGPTAPQEGLDPDYNFDSTQDSNFRISNMFELKDQSNENDRSEFNYEYSHDSIIKEKLFRSINNENLNSLIIDPNDPSYTSEISLDDLTQDEYQEIWSGGVANDFYIWFDDKEGDYSNNEVMSPGGKYKIDIYYQDFKSYGKDGQFLEYLITDDKPDSTTPRTGELNTAILQSETILNSDEEPSWQEGEKLEYLAYQNGYAYIDSTAFGGQTGNLWLRIRDDPQDSWYYHLNELSGQNGYGDQLYRKSDDFATEYKEVYFTPGNNGSYEVEIIADGLSLPNNENKFLVEALVSVKNEIFGEADANGRRDGGKVASLFKALVNAEIETTGGSVKIFTGIIRAFLALYIVIMGYSIIIGFTKFTLKDMAILVVKMGVILTLISPSSWNFFYDNLFSLFIEGVDGLIAIVSGHFSSSGDFNSFFLPTSDPAADSQITGEIIQHIRPNSEINDPVINTFDFFYTTLNVMFATDAMAIKWVALTLSSWAGFLMGMILLASVVFFCWIVFKAFLVYLMAIIIIGLLLFVAPIFLPMILFKKTYVLFESWIKLLISYTLQPIFLFAVLALFNAVYLGIFFKIMNFNACKSCIFFLDLPFSEMLSFGTNFLAGNFDAFCLIEGYTPWGYRGYLIGGWLILPTPVEITTILILLTVLFAMNSFVSWAVEIGEILSAGKKSAGNLYNEAGSVASQGFSTISNTIATPANIYATVRPRKAQSRADPSERYDKIARKGIPVISRIAKKANNRSNGINSKRRMLKKATGIANKFSKL